MISFDFDYYRPQYMHEAINIYNDLVNLRKKPVYYGGGTELISMARAESIKFDAVIDLKYIPELRRHGLVENDYVIGGAVTLTQIAEANIFPLLAQISERIADHTIQDKITIGGNLAGTIIYREIALALMICDCVISIAGVNGLRKAPFAEVFDGKMKLNDGEFIAEIYINKNYLNLPYAHVKRTKNLKIDYPLLTLAAIKKDKIITAAACGLFSKPMLIPGQYVNDVSISADERIGKTTDLIYNYVIEDLSASREYRIFLFKDILKQMLINFESDICLK